MEQHGRALQPAQAARNRRPEALELQSLSGISATDRHGYEIADPGSPDANAIVTIARSTHHAVRVAPEQAVLCLHDADHRARKKYKYSAFGADLARCSLTTGDSP